MVLTNDGLMLGVSDDVNWRLELLEFLKMVVRMDLRFEESIYWRLGVSI